MGKKFDYRQAEDDLHQSGCHYSDEVYAYRSEKDLRQFMKENGLDADKYFKDTGNTGGTGGGSGGTGGGWFSDPDPGAGDGGCYLTTACVHARGLGDGCDELETLRAFRDSFAMNREGGRRDVARYYRNAPAVVEAIDHRPDASDIWNGLYETLVLPCVALVKKGDHEAAYSMYREYALKLEKEYLNK
ncbi:MAG: hypothetical protein J6V01_08495 [Clostridia bacterium]|nr:hypothetical protein [Clostridia bacterium]